MKEIIVNVDNYNENSIKTIEGDNLSEVYKIYICKNKRRIDLTNKIAVMAYVDEYGSKRSNILNLNITNAAEGEIELQITNIISEHNGIYACQIAIYGENNSLEQTAPFSLIVENNIFSKISNTAINSSDFYILSEAIKTVNEYSEKLKEDTENIELKYAEKLNKLTLNVDKNNEQLVAFKKTSNNTLIDGIEGKISDYPPTDLLNSYFNGIDKKNNNVVNMYSPIEYDITNSSLKNAKDCILVGKSKFNYNSINNKVENFFFTVKNSHQHFRGRVNKCCNVKEALEHFMKQAKTGICKVAVIGDSICTTGGTHLKIKYDDFEALDSFAYSPNGLTKIDSYFYRFIEGLTKAYPKAEFEVFNYAIGGSTMLQWEDQKTFNQENKKWIDFVKDCEPDLVLIGWGMNHDRFDYARQTKFQFNKLVDYINTWDKVPSIITSTPPRPVLQTDATWFGNYWAQFSRHISAFSIRENSYSRGLYTLDINRLYNVLKDGIDFEKINFVKVDKIKFNKPIAQTFEIKPNDALTISNGVKDFILECSVVTIAPQNEDYIDIDYNFGIDGLSKTLISKIHIFPNLNSNLVINSYGNFGDVKNYPKYTQTKKTATKNNFTLIIEKRGTELNVYINGIRLIRDRLSLNDLAGGITLTNRTKNNFTINNINLYKGEYQKYIPEFTDTQAWGKYEAEDYNTKEEMGGNGVNHPSTLLLEKVYNECIGELVEDIIRNK